jgi:hypothetical protein
VFYLFSGRFGKRLRRKKDTGVLKQNITLRMVYTEAVGSDLQDTYDVTDRNCHHMALHVVNFCCISEAQETKMPNALLCSVGSRLSSTLGINFEQSASLGSLGSDSFDEESNAQDQPEMCIPDENVDGSTLSGNALLCAQFSQWIYNEEFPSVDTLPLSLDRSTLHCHKECVDEPVRWAAAGTQQHCSFPLSSMHLYTLRFLLISTEGANGSVFIVFRGSANAKDWSTNFAAESRDFGKSHGIQIHSGMDNALGRRNHNVVEKIKAHMKHKISSVGLILAGHSLGGGYAQLVAPDMFDQAIDNAQLRAPTEVITFGAPQAIIPPSEGEGRSIEVWTKLNDVCTMIINSFDPVPRVTGEFCEPWLNVVLDIARNKFSLGGGGGSGS